MLTVFDHFLHKTANNETTCSIFIDSIQSSSSYVGIYLALLHSIVNKGSQTGRPKQENLAKPKRHLIIMRGFQSADSNANFLSLAKVIYTKYSKHWPYTVAHNWMCVHKMLNHGLNHGFFLSLFKLKPCPMHWIVSVLAYLNFIFEF